VKMSFVHRAQSGSDECAGIVACSWRRREQVRLGVAEGLRAGGRGEMQRVLWVLFWEWRGLRTEGTTASTQVRWAAAAPDQSLSCEGDAYLSPDSPSWGGAVEGGHRALKFNRLVGVKEDIYAEGMHFLVPWFETPVIYDIRPRPRMIQSLTGSKGNTFSSFFIPLPKSAESSRCR
jgi:hypothetical protein